MKVVATDAAPGRERRRRRGRDAQHARAAPLAQRADRDRRARTARAQRLPQRRSRASSRRWSHVPLLPAGRDGRCGSTTRSQLPRAAARRVRATVRRGERGRRSGVPRIDARRRPRLEQDPVSGVAAIGFVGEPLAGRAAQAGRVRGRAAAAAASVAAGRAQINRLKPGKRARYQVFFIGNPRGARLEVAAPPTRLCDRR